MATINRTRQRAAFTLLEVILALAILAGSVAMIGEIISFASRSANDSEAETRAQLLAITLMDEMLSGLTEFKAQSRESLEVDDITPWVYSVSLESVSLESIETSGLTSVEVLVEQDLEKRMHPARYRLVRWVPKKLLSSDEEEASDDSNDSNSSDTDTSESTEGDDG